MTQPPRGAPALALALALALLSGAAPDARDPFARFDLPDDWEARFWAGPDAAALFRLGPKALADLVPTQAGVRFCRCPACDAVEDDDPLAWSVTRPDTLTCKRCGVTVPNEKFPAHEDKKPVPEDTVEVLPGVVHHYPYHEVAAEHQRYPDERLYLDAKRDYETRAFLARAALYAAVRYHEQPDGRKDVALARTACLLLVRFAQVYPAYATHFDQPRSAKFFTPADLGPPYRPGYRTAKWEWTGSLDVPLNLVTAYALLRRDPAMAEAGRALGVADPGGLVERDLFRASARFVQRQPEEYGEPTLQAVRGLLAVARVLNDADLGRDARARLDRFAERGFYYDGFYRQGSLAAHRRVVGQLDGWVGRLLPDGPEAGGGPWPMLALARRAGSAVLAEPVASDLLLASWPTPPLPAAPGGPALLGGTGLARLSVGRGADALDLELRSLDAFGPDRLQRQALRLAVGGRPVLDDLDERAPLPTGFAHATASHNTVVVDGLNQRETPDAAREAAPGGNLVFFAADPDFQAVVLDDRLAYPRTATRYRQTLVASATPRGGGSRYAVGVFEVVGGRRHDQVFHAPPGGRGRWRVSVATGPAPDSLLPPGLTYVPAARAGEGRWFVQALGEFRPLEQGAVGRFAQAAWAGPGGIGVRLHLLGDLPMTAVVAESPDSPADLRPSLLLRRQSATTATGGPALGSTFVTVFEPLSGSVRPLGKVGRLKSERGAVVLYVETDEGPEQLVVNLTPGTPRTVALADGSPLTTDGLAVRVGPAGLALAGGTFAEVSGKRVGHAPTAGRVVGSGRGLSAGSQSPGWFDADAPLPDPGELAGRALLVRHGDGTVRGWTLQRVENTPDGARLFVREEPGFALDPATGQARYYQFPRPVFPGPHTFRVSRISRDRPAAVPAPPRSRPGQEKS